MRWEKGGRGGGGAELPNGNRGVGVRRKKEVVMVKEDSEGRNTSSSEKPKIKAF